MNHLVPPALEQWEPVFICLSAICSRCTAPLPKKVTETL